MKSINEETSAWVCDAVRTPIGRYGGALAAVRADDLGAIPIRALMRRNPGVRWDLLDDVIYGCVNQAGEDNRNVARHSALLAGLPVSVPATTVNRLCGSGLDAIAAGARAIATGEAAFVLAGGVESMSRAPFVMGKAESAFSRGAELFDTTMGWRFINPQMQESYGTESMPETAENVAAEHSISRVDQDAFALRSQQRALAAIESGFFAREIEPVTISRRKGDPVIVLRDEHPRATTAAALAALPTPFRREGGTVTPGNASGINDGACALLIATSSAAEQHGLRRRARILGTAVAGVAPRVMGMGPVPAVRKLLAHLGMSLNQFDTIELNEAFAAQALGVLRTLELQDDDPRVNPNGGAIALGHPLGASGARLVTTAINQLETTGGRFALCTMCIGMGQGIAMAIERV